jgi:hypothetical protein
MNRFFELAQMTLRNSLHRILTDGGVNERIPNR